MRISKWIAEVDRFAALEEAASFDLAHELRAALLSDVERMVPAPAYYRTKSRHPACEAALEALHDGDEIALFMILRTCANDAGSPAHEAANHLIDKLAAQHANTHATALAEQRSDE